MSALANSRIDLRKQKNRFRSGLCEIRSGAIQTPLLQVCLCATFVDASLDAVLPGFGGLYLCLIRQPSKQNLAFNLYGRREFNLFSKPSSQDFHLSISLKKETRRTPLPALAGHSATTCSARHVRNVSGRRSM